MSVSCARI